MMNLIPEDQIKSHITLNLTPMIDFLFVLLAFFATLAVTRVTLFDTQLDLVRLNKEAQASSIYTKNEEISKINLTITEKGEYKWITEVHDYPMDSLQKIQKELLHQYQIHLLPEDKSKTKILLQIDKNAPWNAIAHLIFAIRELGFEAYPVYEPENSF